MKIDRERLAEAFVEMCEIESFSREEGEISAYLQHNFRELGAASVVIDDSGAQTGSETGNLVIRFDGDEELGAPLFFGCHMDTVGPVKGIRVVRNDDLFTSEGDTILGSDDKSGIAVLLELMRVLKLQRIAHCPIELVFTTCEEIGLLGAKAFDTSQLRASYGYALDSTKKDRIIIGAPAANRLKVTIHGRAAHSGSAPESGINALAIAAEAVTRLRMGRLDDLSTANLGLINGGTATNIVPETVVLEGEVRSHSMDLLIKHTEHIEWVFQKVIDHWPVDLEYGEETPSVGVEVFEDFPLMSLTENEPVLDRIRKGANTLGFEPQFDIAGGGSDANIFCGNGIKTAILPTGMDKVHTTKEQIKLQDMVDLAQLLYVMVT